MMRVLILLLLLLAAPAYAAEVLRETLPNGLRVVRRADPSPIGILD